MIENVSHKENHNPVVSIVIVDTNGKEFTLPCLESIFSLPPRSSFEVVLVDNCSEISCIPEVKERFPDVRTFVAPERQGFAKNYNFGMRQARGDFFLILNNDTIVKEEAVDRLIAAIRDSSIYGMVGPKLLNTDGSIQPVCARNILSPVSFIFNRIFFDPGFFLGRWWLRYQSKLIARYQTGPVPCISGACMLLPNSVVELVGMLDEGYDFYFEDVEWCHRLQKHGYKIGYVAEAEIIHYGDVTMSKLREWAKKREYLSGLRYFQQYHGMSYPQARLLWAMMILNFSLRWLAFLLIRCITGKLGQLHAYHHLIHWIIENPPSRTDYNHPV